MNDIEHFRRCHKEDPTYTRYHAYKEYLNMYPEEAERIAKGFWDNIDDDYCIMDRDHFRYIISYKPPMEAFRLGFMARGLNGPFDWDSNYFRFPSDGNVESITDMQYKELCKDAADDAYEFVISGDVKVSDELEEILRIFD